MNTEKLNVESAKASIMKKIATARKKDELASLDLNYLNKMKDELNQGLDRLNDSAGLIESRNISKLVTQFVQSIVHDRTTTDITSYLESVLSDLSRVRLIMSLSDVKSNAVIVGANGSGKTTFVNSLAGSGLANLTVIPAQKVLYFSSNNMDRLTMAVGQYSSKYLTSTNNVFKKNEGYESIAETNIFVPFTMLISALVNEVASVKTNEGLHPELKKTITTWERVVRIWRNIIPDIELDIDAYNRCIIATKHGQKYDLNGMSDGEKCILFYIGNVLLAKKDGIVVVDEPETFLNPSIYNKLWDALIMERPDCQFVFASHNIEFIKARTNVKFVWCKKFISEYDKSLLLLDNIKGIPTSLMTELVGSRKKICFCEGKEDSIDYKLLSAVFLREYTIVPVDGHDRVIEYTKAFNDLGALVENNAIGIIDNDGMKDVTKVSLRNQEVYVLPYNEIEMMLFDDVVIKSVLKSQWLDDSNRISKKMSEFKTAFFGKMKQQGDTVVRVTAKTIIDSQLQNGFLNSKNMSSTQDISAEFTRVIQNIDVTKIINEVQTKLKTAIDTNNYEDILLMCNLKGQISKDLANRFLCDEYVDHALVRIGNDDVVKTRIVSLIGLD